MKRRLLLTVAFAAVAVSGWSLWVNACDKSKESSAANYSSASAGGSCASKSGKTSATTASLQNASSEGCAYSKAAATASADHCAGKASATTASAGGACCAKDAKGAKSAKNTAEAMDCSQGLAFAGVLAMPAGGPSCSYDAKKSGRTAHDAHGMDCDACADMAACSDELKANGTQTQVVPLKNGVMFVYTATSANSVRAVQAAMVRRTEKLNAITASGDKASLCPECKSIRGAMASGKMNRETVNIEGGCLTLFTSTDAGMVAKLRAMASSQSNRMKS
jgi:hypothetical protein